MLSMLYGTQTSWSVVRRSVGIQVGYSSTFYQTTNTLIYTHKACTRERVIRYVAYYWHQSRWHSFFSDDTTFWKIDLLKNICKIMKNSNGVRRSLYTVGKSPKIKKKKERVSVWKSSVIWIGSTNRYILLVLIFRWHYFLKDWSYTYSIYLIV